MLSRNSHNQSTISGYYGEIWNDIAEKLDLAYQIVEGKAYGLLQEDGHWSGLVGMVHRNEADIAVADFMPTRAREEVVNFCSLMDSTG